MPKAIRTVSPEDVREIVMMGCNEGICISCGEEAYGVEPDAEGYPCESCEEPKVMGMEQALFAGYIQIDDGDGVPYDV